MKHTILRRIGTVLVLLAIYGGGGELSAALAEPPDSIQSGAEACTADTLRVEGAVIGAPHIIYTPCEVNFNVPLPENPWATATSEEREETIARELIEADRPVGPVRRLPMPRNACELPVTATWRGEPVPNIYFMPYSRTKSYKDWKRLWINTGTLVGAYVGALFVLEMLPEDATSWNRAAIQQTPMFKRWFRNVFKLGPEIDGDKAIFNFVLHPYAGAVYFMAARSCGFNMWQSLLYSACISTIGWEFGIEAFMERPSIQDIFITPLVGSLIGECFYNVKRHIVRHGYTLAGSPVLGNVVAFLVDPVNEVIGLFAGNPCRKDIKYLRERGWNLRSRPWTAHSPIGGNTCYGVQVDLEF